MQLRQWTGCSVTDRSAYECAYRHITVRASVTSCQIGGCGGCRCGGRVGTVGGLSTRCRHSDEPADLLPGRHPDRGRVLDHQPLGLIRSVELRVWVQDRDVEKCGRVPVFALREGTSLVLPAGSDVTLDRPARPRPLQNLPAGSWRLRLRIRPRAASPKARHQAR